MPKLRMLKGLPASGKTTWARNFVKESGSAGRVNRDDLRAMLFDSVWSGRREAAVIDCEKAIVDVLTKHEMSAVIDDTNLLSKHRDMWTQFAQKRGMAFEPIEMETNHNDSRLRDSLRTGKSRVGFAVVDRMALMAGMIQWGEQPIVLCDIDGTLADGTHREHHLEGLRKDWKTYYSKLSDDAPVSAVIQWITALREENTICLVSGRPDTYQDETIAWLNKHNIPFDYIFMRRGDSHIPDTDVKAEFLKYIPKDKIRFVIDDRPRVLRMWKEHGLTAYPVRGAIEDF